MRFSLRLFIFFFTILGHDLWAGAVPIYDWELEVQYPDREVKTYKLNGESKGELSYPFNDKTFGILKIQGSPWGCTLTDYRGIGYMSKVARCDYKGSDATTMIEFYCSSNYSMVSNGLILSDYSGKNFTLTFICRLR